MSAVSMAYDVYEPDDADSNLSPIIFTPGILMSKVMHAKEMSLICKETERKIYCVDLRCHGDSPQTEDFSSSLVAEDLKLFFEEHGIKKAFLIAYSFSSLPGVLFSARYPELVENLIAIDLYPHSKYRGDFEKGLFRMMMINLQAVINNLDPSLTLEEGKEMLIKLQMNNKLVPLPYEFARRNALDLTKKGNKFAHKANLDLILKSQSKGYFEIPEVVYPNRAIFIFGKKSIFFSRYKEMESHAKVFFPNSKVVTIEESTHMMIFENTKELAEEIKKLLSEGEQGRDI